MSMDYYVAVPEADWPTLAAFEQCIAERGYPVIIEGFRPENSDQPFKNLVNSLGLRVRLGNAPVELEFSAIKLSPTTPYAFHMVKSSKPDDSKPSGLALLGVTFPENGKHSIEIFDFSKDNLVSSDINEDLEKIGVKDIRFEHGDYVMTFNIPSTYNSEFAAAAYIMASMIYCFNGYGFEFHGGLHGRTEFADQLVAGAAFLLQENPPE